MTSGSELPGHDAQADEICNWDAYGPPGRAAAPGRDRPGKDIKKRKQTLNTEK